MNEGKDIKAKLPKGCAPIRNYAAHLGVCNGTRLLVRRVINGRLLEAEIATGKHRGDVDRFRAAFPRRAPRLGAWRDSVLLSHSARVAVCNDT